MAGVVGDLNPKTIENAKRQFVELYGSALVMNTYLKIALLLVSLVAVGPGRSELPHAARSPNVKPLVVRIDEVGRAEAVQYDATAYRPQAPELRYFLTQFVVKHFSRIRTTVQREYRTRCSSWIPRWRTRPSRRTTRVASSRVPHQPIGR